MADSIVPALTRFPEEAAVVGRILAGYAEIQFLIAQCADRALRKKAGDARHIAIKAIYRINSESGRIQVADALMRDSFVTAGLEAAYAQAIGATRYCLTLRNQYAHCHWGYDAAEGLFFTNVQDNVGQSDNMTFEFEWRHVDLPLLQQQEAFLSYADKTLQYLQWEFSVRAGMTSGHGIALPKAMDRPPLHNPPELHVLRFSGPMPG